MRTSARGRAFICSFETCVLKAYRCPAKVLTWGFGHTGPDVVEGQSITRPVADTLFEQDLARFESAVGRMVKVPVTQNQFDALVSFAFNCGEGNLASSTLLKMLNDGDYLGAAGQFKRWNKSLGQELAGLTARRLAEADIFTKNLYVNHK